MQVISFSWVQCKCKRTQSQTKLGSECFGVSLIKSFINPKNCSEIHTKLCIKPKKHLKLKSRIYFKIKNWTTWFETSMWSWVGCNLVRTTSFHKTIKGKGKEVRIYVTNMSLIFVSIPLIVEPHWTLSLQF
jgi:hypothetical protein